MASRPEGTVSAQTSAPSLMTRPRSRWSSVQFSTKPQCPFVGSHGSAIGEQRIGLLGFPTGLVVHVLNQVIAPVASPNASGRQSLEEATRSSRSQWQSPGCAAAGIGGSKNFRQHASVLQGLDGHGIQRFHERSGAGSRWNLGSWIQSPKEAVIGGPGTRRSQGGVIQLRQAAQNQQPSHTAHCRGQNGEGSNITGIHAGVESRGLPEMRKS